LSPDGSSLVLNRAKEEPVMLVELTRLLSSDLQGSAEYGSAEYEEEEAMTVGQENASTAEGHAAPRDAWDAIAEGYDRYVALQEVDLANEALALVGLKHGERFLDVAAGTGV
jgi:hypothetical protein